MSIMNLTQHAASADQLAADVFDLAPALRTALAALLTFDSLPSVVDIENRANAIAAIAAANASPDDRADDTSPDDRADNASGFALSAMIGGAPWLMAPLAEALRDQGIEPLFAFSLRESVDVGQSDGSVRKLAMFKHAGWIMA
jgi:hypothetical protein